METIITPYSIKNWGPTPHSKIPVPSTNPPPWMKTITGRPAEPLFSRSYKCQTTVQVKKNKVNIQPLECTDSIKDNLQFPCHSRWSLDSTFLSRQLRRKYLPRVRQVGKAKNVSFTNKELIKLSSYLKPQLVCRVFSISNSQEGIVDLSSPGLSGDSLDLAIWKFDNNVSQDLGNLNKNLCFKILVLNLLLTRAKIVKAKVVDMLPF